MKITAKYILWGCLAVIAIVLIGFLLFLRQKKLADRLANQLKLQKLDIQAESLKKQTENLLADKNAQVSELAVLDDKLIAVERARKETSMKIEGMSNEEITKRLRDLGY